MNVPLLTSNGTKLPFQRFVLNWDDINLGLGPILAVVINSLLRGRTKIQSETKIEPDLRLFPFCPFWFPHWGIQPSESWTEVKRENDGRIDGRAGKGKKTDSHPLPHSFLVLLLAYFVKQKRKKHTNKTPYRLFNLIVQPMQTERGNYFKGCN